MKLDGEWAHGGKGHGARITGSAQVDRGVLRRAVGRIYGQIDDRLGGVGEQAFRERAKGAGLPLSGWW
jgi:hypothetical protein